MSNDLYDLMRCVPSTRRFTADPVPRELLERVLEHARFAPSGGNRQGWRVIVVTDPDEFARNFHEVPVHLVPCVDLEALAIVDSSLHRPSIVGGASIYPFVQNVLLGLRAEGLGAAFTTLLTPAEDEVRALLEIPDGVALAGHISVGYRAEPWPKRLRRNPVAEFTFSERYGRPWVDTGA